MATYLVISRVRQYITLDEVEFVGQEGAVKAAEANITIGADSEAGTGVSAATISSWCASPQQWANSSGDSSLKTKGALPAVSGE